jgi:hypothetical protein
MVVRLVYTWTGATVRTHLFDIQYFLCLTHWSYSRESGNQRKREPTKAGTQGDREIKNFFNRLLSKLSR